MSFPRTCLFLIHTDSLAFVMLFAYPPVMRSGISFFSASRNQNHCFALQPSPFLGIIRLAGLCLKNSIFEVMIDWKESEDEDPRERTFLLLHLIQSIFYSNEICFELFSRPTCTSTLAKGITLSASLPALTLNWLRGIWIPIHSANLGHIICQDSISTLTMSNASSWHLGSNDAA